MKLEPKQMSADLRQSWLDGEFVDHKHLTGNESRYVQHIFYLEEQLKVAKEIAETNLCCVAQIQKELDDEKNKCKIAMEMVAREAEHAEAAKYDAAMHETALEVTRKKLETAEKRVAELETYEGRVGFALTLKQERDQAHKRIAELEGQLVELKEKARSELQGILEEAVSNATYSMRRERDQLRFQLAESESARLEQGHTIAQQLVELLELRAERDSGGERRTWFEVEESWSGQWARRNYRKHETAPAAEGHRRTGDRIVKVTELREVLTPSEGGK